MKSYPTESGPACRQSPTRHSRFGDGAAGFTLIELMIVVAVVGILAAIATVLVVNVMGKARDSQRRDTLTNLSKALEMYYADHGSYPSTGQFFSSEPGNPAGWLNGFSNDGNWIPGLAPAYIAQLPQDPRSVLSPPLPNCNHVAGGYLFMGDTGGYKLWAMCSPEGPLGDSADLFYDPQRPAWAWRVCSGDLCDS